MKIYIIIALSCMCVFFSCSNSKREHIQNEKTDTQESYTEYYSTIPLRESPYADFNGVIRLTKKVADKRNHYRFEYDDNFRLKSISFRLGDKLIKRNHTANYFFTSSVQRFTYTDSLEIRTFYDRFGNQKSQRKAYKEIFTVDNLGRYKALHFEDEDGKRIENSWGIYQYQWEHKTDGSVIEKRVNQKGENMKLRPGFEFYNIRLCYDNNGLLALMQNIDDDGNLIENSSGAAQDKLHFDKQGRWYGWTVLGTNNELVRGNGPNVAKGKNLPDEYGYEASLAFEDVNGTNIINAHGFWGSKRFYDHRGNYDYTLFTDVNGERGINEHTGYSKAKYTWSEDGMNRIYLRLLGIDDKPVLHKKRGYATVKQEYNADGNIIKSSFLGINDKPINRINDGISFITYTYDEKKKLKNRKRYNKDGREIK